MKKIVLSFLTLLALPSVVHTGLYKEVLKKNHLKKCTSKKHDAVVKNFGPFAVILSSDDSCLQLDEQEGKKIVSSVTDVVIKNAARSRYIGSFRGEGSFAFFGSSMKLGDVKDGEQFPLRVLYKKNQKTRARLIAKLSEKDGKLGFDTINQDYWSFSSKKSDKYDCEQ